MLKSSDTLKFLQYHLYPEKHESITTNVKKNIKRFQKLWKAN